MHQAIPFKSKRNELIFAFPKVLVLGSFTSLELANLAHHAIIFFGAALICGSDVLHLYLFSSEHLLQTLLLVPHRVNFPESYSVAYTLSSLPMSEYLCTSWVRFLFWRVMTLRSFMRELTSRSLRFSWLFKESFISERSWFLLFSLSISSSTNVR